MKEIESSRMNLETMTPKESLHAVIAFDPRDWSESASDAWIYGIVAGWNEDSRAELRKKFGWSIADTVRLKKLNEAFWRGER